MGKAAAEMALEIATPRRLLIHLTMLDECGKVDVMENAWKQNAATCDYSFLIQTRNNRSELERTIQSICCEAPSSSQIVVVDGSDVPFGMELIRSMVTNSKIAVVYELDEQKGVFNAMNVGVLKSNGRRLIVLPAGDTMEMGAKELLRSINNSNKEVVVFSQHIIDQEGKLSLRFFPTAKSVWPHQSVVLRREVHEKWGLYPMGYRFLSDQYFFADVRMKVAFEIRPEVLTAFWLGGISSGATMQQSREIWSVRRKLGCGQVSAALHGFVYPYIRWVLERSPAFRGVVTKLRRMIYPVFKKPV
jgi:hypothetical protein